MKNRVVDEIVEGMSMDDKQEKCSSDQMKTLSISYAVFVVMDWGLLIIGKRFIKSKLKHRQLIELKLFRMQGFHLSIQPRQRWSYFYIFPRLILLALLYSQLVCILLLPKQVWSDGKV